MAERRSGTWLRATLWDVWGRYFPDTPVANVVHIEYCRPTKTRLGWIALSESGQSSLIGINRLLGNLDVPDDLATVTIAHELVHYSHGFGSPLPRRYADPHANDVVERELLARGLSGPLVTHQYWAQHRWADYYARHAVGRSRATQQESRLQAGLAAGDGRMAALML